MFGQVAERLRLRPPETEFERGIRHFGNLLTQVMLVMVVIVLAVNIFLAKPFLDSLLFTLALAVGLTPELLPAIISITLSHGAQQMAKRGVIVRRLTAIENFGSMDVLCTDKTGTLTEGVVRLDGALDTQGQPSEAVLRYAYLNAHYQTGLNNPLDEAIQAAAQKAGLDISAEQKVDEIPYDFVRKRLSVVTANAQGERTLITKGALDNILSICTSLQSGDGTHPLDAPARAEIEQRYSEWSEKGFRVLGLATKTIDGRPEAYSRTDENALTFAGFLLFFDPPKADVQQVIVDLAKRGVQLKIITGDNQKVARHVAEAVNLPLQGVLTGSQLNDLHDEALWHLAERTTLFAEVDPNQKERIILALQKTGHVVGYMGDGINDAPALHAADVGLSVDTAVDVAKDAADFVLLKKDLAILRQGIDEGRVTFANTLKYILTTISANFGNMFSMAGASLFLPFLPLLAPQILLNNFLSDIPADDHRQRQCGPGNGGEAAPLEHQVHPQLHGALRSGQFDLRLPDLRDAAVSVPRFAGGVPHRLVHRVPDHRAGHRPGGANAPSLLPQPPGHTFAGEYIDLHWNYPRTAVPAVHLGVWFCPLARTAHADHARADGALRPGH